MTWTSTPKYAIHTRFKYHIIPKIYNPHKIIYFHLNAHKHINQCKFHKLKIKWVKEDLACLARFWLLSLSWVCVLILVTFSSTLHLHVSNHHWFSIHTFWIWIATHTYISRTNMLSIWYPSFHGSGIVSIKNTYHNPFLYDPFVMKMFIRSFCVSIVFSMIVVKPHMMVITMIFNIRFMCVISFLPWQP
jgi:hypothetical protein